MTGMPSRIKDYALLGDTRWQIAPHGLVRATRRRYRGNTLVLETDFDTAEGSIRLVDFIPSRTNAPGVVRLVEGVRGRVRVHLDLRVPCAYADGVWLRTPAETREEGSGVRADFIVTAGELVPFVLTWQPSQEAAPAPIDPFRALADMELYWSEGRRADAHSADWREEVFRSVLALEALTASRFGSGSLRRGAEVLCPTHAAAAKSCSRVRMA
jgi:hypothetical protein